MIRWLVPASVAVSSIGFTIGTGAALISGLVPRWWVVILIDALAVVVWVRIAIDEFRKLRLRSHEALTEIRLRDEEIERLKAKLAEGSIGVVYVAPSGYWLPRSTRVDEESAREALHQQEFSHLPEGGESIDFDPVKYGFRLARVRFRLIEEASKEQAKETKC